MASIPDPGDPTESPPPSFDDFQRQTSLMTSCTLLWKELSDHFTTLDNDLRRKSEALKRKIQTLDDQTKLSLETLKKREVTIEGSVEIAITRADYSVKTALNLLEMEEVDTGGEIDDAEGLLMKLRGFCVKMDHLGFWKFVTVRKKELDLLRLKIPLAFVDCVDPPKFVLEAISEVFPVDKRGDDTFKVNDLGWACVLMLESLIPVMVDPLIGKDRLLVTPSVRVRAEGIAETWKKSLDERGGIENVKTPDVHTFLQHLVTFGIVKEADLGLYRKLIVGSAWRKQMPKLALSLGLADHMPEMIEELISKGQQIDAVHFTYEVGLVDKFPPVPLLKSFLKDAKKAASAILEGPTSGGRAVYLANRKEQSAIRAVLKCIEEYKLEADFPPENLKKRLEQLERSKIDKKKTSAMPANKRIRVCNNGPMPPAKAGRMTNAYVSSFPTFIGIGSPSHPQYPAPAMQGSNIPSYPYSPEAAPAPMSGPYSGASISYPAYGGGYNSGMAPPSYPQVYY